MLSALNQRPINQRKKHTCNSLIRHYTQKLIKHPSNLTNQLLVNNHARETVIVLNSSLHHIINNTNTNYHETNSLLLPTVSLEFSCAIFTIISLPLCEWVLRPDCLESVLTVAQVTGKTAHAPLFLQILATSPEFLCSF